MKLIQAMKKLKDLNVKGDDLRKKIMNNCADLSIETPQYPDQKRQISEWLQAHSDVIKETLRLKVAIQRTNLNTKVTIELGGKQVEKTITEWVYRRGNGSGNTGSLAKLEQGAWALLTDRGLKEQNMCTVAGGPVTEIRVRRYFDPAERDQKVELYRSEPSIIDSTLEIVNAVTDLIEE